MRTSNITLVDTALLEKTPAPPAPEPTAPGAMLPADFPCSDFTTEQLILLEELFFRYTREFILRFFRIIASPVSRNGNPVKSSVSNIACQTVVLAKLLGLNESMTWHDLASFFGISKHSILAAKDNALRQLDRLATRGSRTTADWATLAAYTRRQARAYALKARTTRHPAGN